MRYAALALLLLIPPTASAAAAPPDEPVCSALFATGSVALSTIAAADALARNTFEPWTGGDYPGMVLVATAASFLEDEVSPAATDACLGTVRPAYWTAHAAANATLNDAETRGGRALACAAPAVGAILGGQAPAPPDPACAVRALAPGAGTVRSS